MELPQTIELRELLSYEYKYTQIRTDELPAAPNISYLLCDSWYACGKVMDAFVKCGYYTVGAVKTNRILYFKGIRIGIRQLAEKLEEGHCDELFHIVTVKGCKYYVYRYEDNLNGIENAAVLLTFPVDFLYHQTVEDQYTR